MAHFFKTELTGTTYDEALANAPYGIQGNATQAWKNFQKNNPGIALTDAVKRQWMEEYLTKKSKNLAGVGFYIVNVPAVVSDRKRPYLIENIKNDKGARKYKTAYVGIDNATGEELFCCMTNKSDALNMAKELYTEKNYTGKGHIDMRKVCVEGVETVATFEYAPSKGSHPCTVEVFGIVND